MSSIEDRRPAEFFRLKSVFLSIHDMDFRRNEFCKCMCAELYEDFAVMLISDKSLFPSPEDIHYFLKFAIKHGSLRFMDHLGYFIPNFHEFIFEDGKSIVHHLAELDGSSERNYKAERGTMLLVRGMLLTSREHHRDAHGYTYFHAACMAGERASVRRFISEGVDVNLDTYKRSPLHMAAQYRRTDIVQLLLEKGANPNQLDDEMSTPLHALSRLCLCECGTESFYCDYRRPVDEIIGMLIEKGANIEARNRDGDTALQLAVCSFDAQLVKSLLKHGAKLKSLNEERMFSRNFESIERKYYPLTLNVIEVIQLLQSAGYRLSLKTRLWMLRCWMRVRGNDTEHLNPYYDDYSDQYLVYAQAVCYNYIHEKYGFFLNREVVDLVNKRLEKCKPTRPDQLIKCELDSLINSRWEIEARKLADIEVIDKVSLHAIARMSYDEGYSILKSIKNCRVSLLDDLSHGKLYLMVKRHIGHILIKQHLALFAADLFMTDYCKLDLPYTVCHRLAEKMSYENLFRLCEQTDEASL